MKIIVNARKCPQNHKCPAIAVCPEGAIRQRGIFSLPNIDEKLCIMCEKCVKSCPKGAFEKVESEGKDE